MSKTVVAIFSKETANFREAVENLRQARFDREISLLARDNEGKTKPAAG